MTDACNELVRNKTKTFLPLVLAQYAFSYYLHRQANKQNTKTGPSAAFSC